MADLTLAKAFIDIGYRGFEKIDSMMGEAVKTIKKNMEPIQKMFDQAANAMANFGRSGSPLAFSTFTQSIEVMKASIGSAFTTPILRASKSIQDLTKWIQGLDRATVNNIAQWVMFGTVALGAVLIIGKVGMAIIGLWNVMKFFATSNPLILALTATIVLLLEVERRMNNMLTGMQKNVMLAERMKKTVTKEEFAGTLAEHIDKKELSTADKIDVAQKAKERGDEEVKSISKFRMQQTPAEAARDKVKGTLDEDNERVQHLTRQGAILENYINQMKEKGKFEPGTVPDAKAAGGGGVKLGLPSASASSAGIGSLESAYSKFQQQVLGQSDLAQQQLDIQKRQEEAALKQAGSIEGFHKDFMDFVGGAFQ